MWLVIGGGYFIKPADVRLWHGRHCAALGRLTPMCRWFAGTEPPKGSHVGATRLIQMFGDVIENVLLRCLSSKDGRM